MEEWRFVPGLEDLFIISSTGRVFSVRTEKYLKYVVHPHGYRVFSTRIGGRSGKAKCYRIHRLVAEAFVDNHDNKPMVNHKDGNKINNHYSNLEWVTNKENVLHAKSLGLLVSPNKGKFLTESPLFSLSEDQVKFIKDNYKKGCKNNGSIGLAKQLGVERGPVRRVIERLGL